jgi:ATP-dependent DNA helicase DinG
MTATVIPLRRQPPPGAYLREAFEPDGLLARANPGYEFRPGQLQLAEAVDRAINEDCSAFIEGPCGTGKSIGYLVPAIHHALAARKRAIVSTASIALQEQLVTKDLPALAAALPEPFSFALLKGRANYVCNDALEVARESPPAGVLSEPDEYRQFADIVRWASKTTTGDKGELPFVPLERLWNRLTVDSDDCKGEDCPSRRACHFERARQAAIRADVLVVNHHLLCADQAVRQLGAPPILPEAAALVVDEAHELPDTARGFFGATITRSLVHRVEKYARFVLTSGTRLGLDPDALRLTGERYFDALTEFALAHERRQIGDRQSRYGVKAPVEVGLEVPLEWPAAIALLAKHAEREYNALAEAKDLPDHERQARATHRTAARRLGKAIGWLDALHTPGPVDDGLALWVEMSPPDAHGRRRVVLEGRQLDVTGPLRTIAARQPTVLTSATLTVAGSFEFIRRETGIDAGVRVEVPSPFDFSERCLLVAPPTMPAPDHPAWPAACAQIVRRLVDAADGRTLALFSSRANLDRVWQQVATTSERQWLRQGDLPPRELAKRFRADERAVLFGLKSFWTGLDVPGDSLVAVFIDRIPFPQRDEPVIARLRKRAGDNAFDQVDLPRALMQLRQGFGRLIRSKDDYGVVVLGDARVLSKGWGRKAFASLPRCKRGRGSADVAAFLATFTGEVST